MRLLRLLLIPALFLAPALQVAARSPAKAPKVADSQIVRPLPLPYDVDADAEAQLRAALAKAKAGNKLVLIDLGGNWCLDCRVLAGVMDIPALRAFIAKHYELVSIDIGRMDKNQQIPERYGILRLKGVPALLIVDPQSGKLINKDRIFALADARSMTAQALADWLAKWV
ncbi:thioredoxin family protein [Rhizorhabdus argentea]|uniref:thioredoxin family protein n=1 Tax=Rhizorhabdus argentea TaxID=1387174 RepID=UPI003BF4F321